MRDILGKSQILFTNCVSYTGLIVVALEGIQDSRYSLKTMFVQGVSKQTLNLKSLLQAKSLSKKVTVLHRS